MRLPATSCVIVITLKCPVSIYNVGPCYFTLCQLELCNTIDTTRYRDTKQYRSTSSFGIVGIDYATYNQTGDDFGSHFQLI